MTPNIAAAEADWPPAVVAGGFITGVVLMRSLHRRGLRVCCIETDPRQVAFRTIYGKAFQCPNPDHEPGEWIRFMIELAGSWAGRPGVKPVLISSSDQFVSAIADHADALAPHFTFCYSGASTQALLATKKRQYEIAADNGLPVARTQLVQSMEDLRNFTSSALFPCLMKPLHFRHWKSLAPRHPLLDQKLVLASTPEELENQYSLASEINPQVVVQEIIQGPDTNKMVYLSCYSQQGERLAGYLVRQVRTDPVYFGSASVVEPLSDPDTSDLCDRFLRNVGYKGICEIELKRDDRDGKVKMIEANPRYSVTSDAAIYAGIDIGWLHYLDLIGKPVFPVESNGRYFRHICLFRDIAAMRDAHREGLGTWGELLSAYRKPVAFFDFDWNDRKLAIGSLIRVAKLIAGPAVRRYLPRTRGH